jgi:hypothetical protein
MKGKKSVVCVSTPKTQKKVAKKQESAPALEFKAIPENELKMQDKRFLSCVIGQFALSDSYELPLTVEKTDDGKACQAYALINVERAFYALFQKMRGKVRPRLEKREAQDGCFYVVILEKTAKKQAVKFNIEVKDSDKKLIASGKRKARAAKNKEEKEKAAIEKNKDTLAEWKETAQKQAELAIISKEKRAAALSQKDGKKANELLAQETACAKLALLANIKIVLLQKLPNLSKDKIEDVAQAVYSVVK